MKGLAGDLTPPLYAELCSLGIDTENLLPGYPVEMVSKGLRVAAKHLPHPDGESAALRELGRRFMRGSTRLAPSTPIIATIARPMKVCW